MHGDPGEGSSLCGRSSTDGRHAAGGTWGGEGEAEGTGSLGVSVWFQKNKWGPVRDTQTQGNER